MSSVLQDWVMELPLRAQGTLLTGIRGCDLTPKSLHGDPPERRLVAFLRYCVMNPATPEEVDIPGAFMQSSPPNDSNWKASQFGHYPVHWYEHMMHCFEVIGYMHPDESIAVGARRIYFRFVNNLHLTIETKAEMILRLTENRITKGNVVS